MLIELTGIRKRFSGVTALTDGSLTAGEGEIHLLVGENGAGKSTLMRMVAGMCQPDGGRMLWRGAEVRLRHPTDAARLGIAMVHQESLLAPHLTVAENIFLGREPASPPGWVSRRRIAAAAARLIEEHRFPLQAEWRVGRLSPAGRQLVEICRAIQHGSSLLIFDEPTSSLSGNETREVFRLIRALRERGMSVIYITHRLEELRAIGDRVTILRDGATVHSGPLAGITTSGIIRHMVGREVPAGGRRIASEPGDEVLRVEGLTAAPYLRDIGFTVRAGEIVGLAGLLGAGRTELCRALFGLEPLIGGRVLWQGRELKLRSPRDAVRAGLALIPEDRQQTGLAARLPVGHNVTLANLEAVSRAGGLLDGRRERDVVRRTARRLGIRMSSPQQLAGGLSGGNQQTVVIARWLVRGARAFLFDEPTRGIDVGAKAEVFAVMDQLARDGAGILMVSSELPELILMADRILVMRQGRMAGELPRGASQEEILRLAALPEEAVA